MKQSCNLEDIRLLDRQRLKNMMGILLVALYFLSVHLGQGLRLEISAGHMVSASKRFYGISEFCYYALADGVGALLSRIRPKKADPPPESAPREMLPGFCWKAQFLSRKRVAEIPPENRGMSCESSFLTLKGTEFSF